MYCSISSSHALSYLTHWPGYNLIRSRTKQFLCRIIIENSALLYQFGIGKVFQITSSESYLREFGKKQLEGSFNICTTCRHPVMWEKDGHAFKGYAYYILVHFLEPTCAYCMVGSYALLSVCHWILIKFTGYQNTKCETRNAKHSWRTFWNQEACAVTGRAHQVTFL